MYQATVNKESKLGIDYLVTTIYKDGVVLKCTYEQIKAINVLEQTNNYTLMKSIAEQKLNHLKNI
jgi:hypothetical protein